MSQPKPDPCYHCQGACCESIVLPLFGPPDQRDFIAMRGEPVRILGATYSEVESRCPMLGSCGTCKIHSRPSYPKACASYEVGGMMCRLTVARRRKGTWRSIVEAELDALERWRLSNPGPAASTDA